MNELAAWGFRTPEAFERHCNPPAQPEERGRRFAQGRWVTPEEIEAYAATLTEVPTSQAVWKHFGGARASAYNYRTKVIAILARRAQRESAPARLDQNDDELPPCIGEKMRDTTRGLGET